MLEEKFVRNVQMSWYLSMPSFQLGEVPYDVLS